MFQIKNHRSIARRQGRIHTGAVWASLLCLAMLSLCPGCLPCPDGDKDSDFVCDEFDNCPDMANAGQFNSDADTLGDACDNCPNVTNEAQIDSDSDGTGDACETEQESPE